MIVGEGQGEASKEVSRLSCAYDRIMPVFWRVFKLRKDAGDNGLSLESLRVANTLGALGRSAASVACYTVA